jgi:ADP-ribose pyrophosphatase
MSYRLIEKQLIYRGAKVNLEVHHLEDEADGTRTRREVVVHPGAVVVLPLLEEDRVLLIRNRRYAVGAVLLELPAGTLEKGEDPMNCAGRELLEETGYLAKRLRLLGSFYSSPGVLTEKMHAFVAYDLQEETQALEAGEEIELEPVPLAEAIEMIRDGRIQDGKTVATLLMYERFWRERQAGSTTPATGT